MTRSTSPKAGAYAALAALFLLGALVLELPELVVLAAPFLLVLVAGVALAREPDVSATVELARDRAVEGDEVEVVIRLEAPESVERIDVFLAVPRRLSAVGGNPVAVRLPGGRPRELRLTLRCARWGAALVGVLYLRAHDPLGLFRWEARLDRRTPLKVYPGAETVRTLLRPLETQVFTGNQVARQKGEGLEFADLRPFLPGDRIRGINWRASARRGSLWVNERHAERNGDVVLFLDTFAEARRGRAGTLDLAVRAAGGLAAGYLGHKDRVGFVSFGGVLNWLQPSTGTLQLYRIADSLLDTEIVLNYAWKGVDVLPRRTLPPQALVVALTPLLDARATTALLDLRARGFDLVVVDVSPLPYVEAGEGEVGELAHRLWRLQREAVRGRYERAGVPVASWDERAPLAAVVEEVRAFRRHASRARA